MARSVQDPQAPIAKLELLAVTEGAGDMATGAERAEGCSKRAEDGNHLRWNPVPPHDRLGKLVIGTGAVREALQVRRQQVDRGDLRARPTREDFQQAEMVHVLMSDHDQTEILDPAAELGERAFELVQRLSRVGPRVEEGKRLVLDQIAIDTSHQERRRDRQAMDTCTRRERQGIRLARPPGSRSDYGEHLVAAAFHVLARAQRLEAPVAVAARCSMAVR